MFFSQIKGNYYWRDHAFSHFPWIVGGRKHSARDDTRHQPQVVNLHQKADLEVLISSNKNQRTHRTTEKLELTKSTKFQGNIRVCMYACVFLSEPAPLLIKRHQGYLHCTFIIKPIQQKITPRVNMSSESKCRQNKTCKSKFDDL